MQLKIVSAALGGVVVCALTSQAAVGNLGVTKANGNFIAGTGIPSDQFNLSGYLGTEIGVKARGRVSGQPLARDATRYYVQDGPVSLAQPTVSWWNIDFQFSAALLDTVNGQNYILQFELDTNPAFGTSSFASVSMPIFDGDSDPFNSWDDGDGFFVNPGSGAWNTNDIDYVVSQSWQPNFPFLAGAILPPGEYDVRLSLRDTSSGLLARTSIVVEVIPTPGAGAIAGLGLLSLAARRRRA